jgi:hypothetical protein
MWHCQVSSKKEHSKNIHIMKKILYKFGIVSIVGTGLATLGSAQTEVQSGQSGSSSSSLNSSNTWGSAQLSATGRSSVPQAVRGSKLMGAEVRDSSGSRIGRIEDVIVNPASGRVDFAVIARGGQGGSSSPSGSSAGSGSDLGSSQGNATDEGAAGGQAKNTGSGIGSDNSAGGTSSESSSTYRYGSSPGSSDKLIPVPWALLQTSSASGAQSFTLSVDQSKLDQAPVLSRSSWSEIGQTGWSQRINSYFGVSDSSSTGGAESPSGTSSGSSSKP